jgi:hypothetical protein
MEAKGREKNRGCAPDSGAWNACLAWAAAAAAAAFVENERRGFATFSLPLFSPSLPLFSLSLPLSLSLSLLARRPKKQAQKIAV